MEPNDNTPVRQLEPRKITLYYRYTFNWIHIRPGREGENSQPCQQNSLPRQKHPASPRTSSTRTEWSDTIQEAAATIFLLCLTSDSSRAIWPVWMEQRLGAALLGLLLGIRWVLSCFLERVQKPTTTTTTIDLPAPNPRHTLDSCIVWLAVLEPEYIY